MLAVQTKTDACATMAEEQTKRRQAVTPAPRKAPQQVGRFKIIASKGSTMQGIETKRRKQSEKEKEQYPSVGRFRVVSRGKSIVF